MGSNPALSAELVKDLIIRALSLDFRALFQYGDLHEGHTPGSPTVLWWFPLVGTAITFIAFSFERDHAHVTNILDNNILSRFIFLLTNIYLSSNIFLR